MKARNICGILDIKPPPEQPQQEKSAEDVTDGSKLDPSQVGCRMGGGGNCIGIIFIVLGCAGSCT